MIPTPKSPILKALVFILILEFASSIAMALVGGITETHGFQNSAEIEDLARFAVAEHNSKQNALLEFARVVKAKQQVVAGMLHHLTVEVVDSGAKKLYEAKVWVKPWLQFKELQEFKHVGEVEDDSSSSAASTITAADLGCKRGGHEPGWRTVPAHDPSVKDAANHAVKSIQERSNSLSPYELLEILHAKAEVIEDLVKYNLLLKLKRGTREENFNVEVHKKPEGSFHLNLMQLEQPNVTSQ